MKRIIPVVALVALFGVAGCKEKQQEGEDGDLARQVFAAETNTVELMKLEKRDFHKQIVSNGRLEAHRRAALAFQTQGRIAEVRVYDGMRVEKGDVLATLDLEDATIALESTRLAFETRRLDLADRLLDYGYGPEVDTASIPGEQMRVIYLRSGYIDARRALDAARLTHERSTLVAPFAGRVADVELKAYEQSSGAFCTVIDDALFDVKFSVLETEVGFVKMGQPVKVYSFNDPDNVIEGRVTAINPTVDENGQISITARIPGRSGMIDGMNVRVLAENVVPGQLVVPKSAVVTRDGLLVLFRYGDGKALWTYVHTTADNSTEYVVAPNTERGADLNPGDMVIVSGNFNLGDNTPVVVAGEASEE